MATKGNTLVDFGRRSFLKIGAGVAGVTLLAQNKLFGSTQSAELDKAYTWLDNKCFDMVAGAKFFSKSWDSWFYYPLSGGAMYPSFYLRDFVYMFESAPDFFAAREVRHILDLLISKQRADGWIAERLMSDGTVMYCCHGCENGDVLDSNPFFVKLAHAYAQASGDEKFIADNLDKLWKSLTSLPQEADTGLMWVDPKKPHTAYGFTDSIAKTGRELFCSLLTFEALGIVNKWAVKLDRKDIATPSEAWRKKIQQNLALLKTPEGMYYAGSVDCHQIDIWGSIYACFIDAISTEERAAVYKWLMANQDKFLQTNHIRHLPAPEYWQKVIIPVAPGEFQNGPYWSTPSGWYAELLERQDPGSGVQFMIDLVGVFQKIGVFECIDAPRKYFRGEGNLSSAVLPYASLKRLRASTVGLASGSVALSGTPRVRTIRKQLFQWGNNSGNIQDARVFDAKGCRMPEPRLNN